MYKRVIPVLLLQNSVIVRSEGFNSFKPFGNPIDQLVRLSEWDADELVYIDITRGGGYDARRLDHHNSICGGFLSIVRRIARYATMPLTFGGRIFNISQVDELIHNGADKVLVNTGALRNPTLITQIAKKYGSQCCMVGMDVKGGELWYDQGKFRAETSIKEWVKEAQSRGAGEILLNSIDRDGKGTGYDIELYKEIADSTTLPVIAMGGIGKWEQMIEALKSGISAVAAGNIFNFTELSYIKCKKYLKERGISYVR